jgi:hypothetical protein
MTNLILAALFTAGVVTGGILLWVWLERLDEISWNFDEEDLP